MRRIALRGLIFGFIVMMLQIPSLYAASDQDYPRAIGAQEVVFDPDAASPQDYPRAIGAQEVVFDPVNSLIQYVATNNHGVVRTIDGGNTWIYGNNDLAHSTINSLAIDPTDTQVLYVGTMEGIYKSYDGGRSWGSIGYDDYIIQQVLVDPQNPSNVYASTYLGVLKSFNAGASWQFVNNGFSEFDTHAIAIDPLTPSTLYASMRDGLYKSTDSAASWQQLGIDTPPYTVFRSVAIDPTNPSRIYIASYNGMYTTVDAGATWDLLTDDDIESIAINPKDPQTVYITIKLDYKNQVYVSHDYGATWSSTSPTIGSIGGMLSINPADPALIYVSTNWQGVIETNDAGGTWNQVNFGLPPTSVNAIVSDPNNPDVIFSGYFLGDGIFKSLNSGATWQPYHINDETLTATLMSVEIDASDSQTVYAPTLGAGVLKSSDGGKSWIVTENRYGTVWSLAIDPHNPRTLYAGALEIYRSTDEGTTWHLMETTLPSEAPLTELLMDPNQPGFMMAGTWYHGVYRSRDYGATWEATEIADLQILYLEFSSVDRTTIYVGTNKGLYLSKDYGDSWVALGLADRHVQSVAVDPLHPTTIYAGSEEGLFKTIDGGQHWSAIDVDLFAAHPTNVTALYINPNDPTTLYIGTSSAGLYVRRTSSIYIPAILK